ncbi:MAG: hypothetical protein IJV14_12775, partial [Lachnospiraceae bacterium]|nr:hypothetical protein [Lachnospiraceae bacterium]
HSLRDHGTDPEMRKSGKNGHPDSDVDNVRFAVPYDLLGNSLGLHAVLNTEDGMSHNKRRTEEI